MFRILTNKNSINITNTCSKTRNSPLNSKYCNTIFRESKICKKVSCNIIITFVLLYLFFRISVRLFSPDKEPCYIILTRKNAPCFMLLLLFTYLFSFLNDSVNTLSHISRQLLQKTVIS